VRPEELPGIVLDWAVAKIEGTLPTSYDNWKQSWPKYSSDWSVGGLIVESNGIGLLFDGGSACRKPSWFATPEDQSVTTSYEGQNFDAAFMVDECFGVRGETPLIAAMRCYVKTKLGNNIKFPEELILAN
jgi:Protein of unknown function (DUF2591)